MPNTPDNPPSNQEKYLAQLIENQKEDLKLRAEELELRKQANENQYKYAIESLAVQERVLTVQTKNSVKQLNARYFLIAGIITASLIFIGFALYLNKDQIVMELIRAALYIFGGGAGGYYIGKFSNKEHKEKPENRSTTSVMTSQ
jgi:hypothetical protein